MHVHPKARFKTFVEIKDYIYSTLCQREQLQVGAFPMTQQVLRQGEKLCGFLFSIHGPRSVIFNAVFELERNAIHFYNSSGERFLTTSIGVAPPVINS
jgi:hypothetical protein